MCNKSAYCILLCIAICTQGLWCKNIERKRQKRNDSNSRIIGGQDEDIETYPYMAYLQMDNGSQVTHCGGTIISNNSIVTAAHCLEGVKTVKVRIGSRYSNTGGRVYLLTDFNQHPSFSNSTYDYDIGIVNVKDGMMLDGETASTIGVASISNDPPEGEYMFISGWGPTVPGGEPSVVLQGAKIPVVGRTYCESRIHGITRRMYCAGKGDINSCKEDFGGPAVGKSFVLNGVASFGVKCGVKGYPTVYARIGHPLIRSYIRTMTGV